MTTTRPLPENPNLDHLRSEARSLQRRIRSGDEEARATAADLAGRDLTGQFDSLQLSTAQWLVARSYGYPSWPRLRRQLEIIAHYTRFPEPAGEQPDDPADLVDHFLRLSVLNYTRDDPAQFNRARTLLIQHPGMAEENVFTAAVTGRTDRVRRLLAEDPGAADRIGGPYDWAPLLYLTAGRIDDDHRTATATAEVLLAGGADANAGYLWRGMTSPFTALTCALGGGEQDQPPHSAALTLAGLLLEAGADPNDNQALYNRMFRPENDHLELLFDHGLGEDVPSVWRDRLGADYPTVTQMLGEQLRWAAAHDFTDRIQLLLDHGVDPDNRGYHPNFQDRSAIDLAREAGHADVIALLDR